MQGEKLRRKPRSQLFTRRKQCSKKSAVRECHCNCDIISGFEKKYPLLRADKYEKVIITKNGVPYYTGRFFSVKRTNDFHGFDKKAIFESWKYCQVFINEIVKQDRNAVKFGEKKPEARCILCEKSVLKIECVLCS